MKKHDYKKDFVGKYFVTNKANETLVYGSSGNIYLIEEPIVLNAEEYVFNNIHNNIADAIKQLNSLTGTKYVFKITDVKFTPAHKESVWCSDDNICMSEWYEDTVQCTLKNVVAIYSNEPDRYDVNKRHNLEDKEVSYNIQSNDGEPRLFGDVKTTFNISSEDLPF